MLAAGGPLDLSAGRLGESIDDLEIDPVYDIDLLRKQGVGPRGSVVDDQRLHGIKMGPSALLV